MRGISSFRRYMKPVLCCTRKKHNIFSANRERAAATTRYILDAAKKAK